VRKTPQPTAGKARRSKKQTAAAVREGENGACAQKINLGGKT